MPQTESTLDCGDSSQRPPRVSRENQAPCLTGRSATPADGRSATISASSVSVRASSARSTRSANSSRVRRPSTVASRRVTMAASGLRRRRGSSRQSTGAWRYAELGTVRLHYVEEGEGPLVVLLHGFPEFWYGWRHQIGPLAAAGFRVVAPDLRGYNLSSKPRGRAAYALPELARDVARADRRARAPSGRTSPATTGAARSPGRPRCTTPSAWSGSRSSTRPTRGASSRRCCARARRALLVHGGLPAAVAAGAPRPEGLPAARRSALPRGVGAAWRADRHAQLLPGDDRRGRGSRGWTHPPG